MCVALFTDIRSAVNILCCSPFSKRVFRNAQKVRMSLLFYHFIIVSGSGHDSFTQFKLASWQQCSGSYWQLLIAIVNQTPPTATRRRKLIGPVILPTWKRVQIPAAHAWGHPAWIYQWWKLLIPFVRAHQLFIQLIVEVCVNINLTNKGNGFLFSEPFRMKAELCHS